MSRFFSVLFLIGTLSGTALAINPESVQVDRQELREAMERFVREHPAFVPDLRSTAPAIAEQAGYKVSPEPVVEVLASRRTTQEFLAKSQTVVSKANMSAR